MDPYNHLRSYGEALIESIDSARAEEVAVRALAAPSAGLPLRRRIVAIAAASATFITGNVGMALAADSAIPGDLLYGLDRAYEQVAEWVGFSDDHTSERLDEAAELAAAGDTTEALTATVEQMEALEAGDGDLGDAVNAITSARDNALDVPANETAAEATEHAKAIVAKAHEIAEAIQNGDDREDVRLLIDELKELARANNNGKALGLDKDKDKDKNNGLGPPDDRGNGGDRGNSGQVPKP
ncbi:MAG: hypothetical protein OEX97_08510 [Acidimicrobiia bacterium]|nr:hypothetical protein [Acidimicrobiia bacterium]